MNMVKWFFYLVVGCLSCSKSSTTPDPEPAIDGPYRVTATLNDSTWYGSAYASKSVTLSADAACASNRVDIGFSTDLPYGGNIANQAVTGCVGECIPTQVLSFHNVPLAVGTYQVASLNSCAGRDGAVLYYWLLGGDAIVNTFTFQSASIGWIQITAYNADQQAIQGTFEVELSDKTSKTARFKNGSFQTQIK